MLLSAWTYRHLPAFKVIVVVILATMTQTAWAQINPQGVLEIEQGGQLWIEGSASVVDYKCHAEQFSGWGAIDNSSHPQQSVRGDEAVSINVSIPVKSFECGKKAMNEDMYEALKADKHDAISYQLLNATQANRTEEAGWMDIKTTGVLEIAGVKDTTHVMVKGKLLGENRFRVTGSKQINMDTYDIKPPTALFGLIKAKKDLTVHFDVTVRLRIDG